ncbi:dimethylaniline monooxygenase [N-oxide-forming] 2-like [Pelodytes ibericus]
MVKTVAIIGAGVSGLTAIKSCVEEGLEPTCFERSDGIGGLWRFRNTVEDGCPSIYHSLVTNASKEIMSFSDFPMPDDFPNFLPNHKYFEYCKMYAEHFQLCKYIKFKTAVCRVQKHPDFDLTGQWIVTTETENEKQTAVFDAVIVCSGQYVDPKVPLDSVPGIDKFKGEVLHCRDYKRPAGFDDKKVLIVGMGNSGVDLSTELCTSASQVYLSTRRGVLVLRRLGMDGYPYDIFFITRFKNWLRNTLPSAVSQWLMNKQMNEQFNHALYGVKPEGVLTKEPLVNEELPSRILAGLVVMKPGITKFTETSVHFTDGTIVDNLDVVILATGYNFTFSFLDESVIKVDNTKGFLYKRIFPVNYQKHTIAFVGFIQPIGPLMSSAELQNRWIAKIFKGIHKLPNCEEMMDDLKKDEQLRKERFGSSEDNFKRVDYIEYMDDLASQINVKPNIVKLLLTDPVLALKVIFGPTNSYQYRLTGPGKWDGARKAIMTQWERINKPLRTRGEELKACKSLSSIFPLSALLPWFLCILVLFVAIWIKG